MNRLITSIIVCFVAIVAMAQNNVAVEYDVTTHDSDSGEPYTQKMTFVANLEKSLYFNKMSLYVDSCNSTPEGKAKLREIQLKAWRVVQPDGTVTYDGRKLGLAPEKKIFYMSPRSQSEENCRSMISKQVNYGVMKNLCLK